jgi:hypothetical protein
LVTHVRLIIALAVSGLLWIACPASAQTISSSPYNLLVDGAAEEAGSGVPGWVGTPGYTTTAYGTSGEYPGLAVSESMAMVVAGPTWLGGGARFFDPGAVTTAMLSQVLDVSSHAATIDADQQAIDFGGWLGGYGSSRDMVEMVVTPLDAGAKPTSDPWVLRGPTAAQREDRTTLIDEGYVNTYDHQTGDWGFQPIVPPGTRSVRVELIARENEAGETKNHGYADELSLSLWGRSSGAPAGPLIAPQSGAAVLPLPAPTVKSVRRMALEDRHTVMVLNTGIDVGCPPGGPSCRVTATVTGPIGRSVARKTTTGRTEITLMSGGKTRVRLRLSNAVTAAVRGHRRPRVRVAVTARQGPAPLVTVTRTATL